MLITVLTSIAFIIGAIIGYAIGTKRCALHGYPRCGGKTFDSI
jgi:hypothetical protein